MFAKTIFVLTAFLLWNGAGASAVEDDSSNNREAIQHSNALRAGIQRASFWPQSPLRDNLRNLKKNKKAEKLFDPVEDAIKDLDKKEEKKLKKKLKKVIKELSKKKVKEDKVEKAIEKFLKELDELLEEEDITQGEYDTILGLFNIAIGQETTTTTSTTTTTTTPWLCDGEITDSIGGIETTLSCLGTIVLDDPVLSVTETFPTTGPSFVLPCRSATISNAAFFALRAGGDGWLQVDTGFTCDEFGLDTDMTVFTPDSGCIAFQSDSDLDKIEGTTCLLDAKVYTKVTEGDILYVAIYQTIYKPGDFKLNVKLETR